MKHPKIIQGGMGIAVSSWKLASAVSQRGQLGVVSGTGIDAVLARRLQLGDIGGHLREALAAFPIPDMAARVAERYFVEGGKPRGSPFKSKPVPTIRPSRALVELIIVANFAEVYLAKRGHAGVVGLNLLEKIQLPTLPSLFGAMLAKVDYVLMGAGIPRAIPAALDRLAELNSVDLKLDVTGAKPDDQFVTRFDPREFTPDESEALKRPRFLAIISSSALATTLARKSTGEVNGFVVEGKTAGGHNAPPRGQLTLSDSGEPIYGPRDEVDLAQMRELGLPFWLAGSFGGTSKLNQALRVGAEGVQAGTAFAFCEESGMDPAFKRQVIQQSIEHRCRVFTDPHASPTGFPFKILDVPETISDQYLFATRERTCDLGYLRELYRREDGSVGYRCSAEPVEDYVRKGGDPLNTVCRKCLCNGLMATIGLGQIREGSVEHAIITSGDDVANVAQFLRPGEVSYTAGDVIDKLLSDSCDPNDETL